MGNFTYNFSTDKTASEVYNFLLDSTKWWVGFYEETITGSSQNIGDEFSFFAGGGMHITKQKLVELIPSKKIAWLVIESNLSYLKDHNEWNNTKLIFNISKNSTGDTLVQFTHEGLAPQVECYNQCSSTWLHYLEQLETKLKKK